MEKRIALSSLFSWTRVCHHLKTSVIGRRKLCGHLHNFVMLYGIDAHKRAALSERNTNAERLLGTMVRFERVYGDVLVVHRSFSPGDPLWIAQHAHTTKLGFRHSSNEHRSFLRQKCIEFLIPYESDDDDLAQDVETEVLKQRAAKALQAAPAPATSALDEFELLSGLDAVDGSNMIDDDFSSWS